MIYRKFLVGVLKGYVGFRYNFFLVVIWFYGNWLKNSTYVFQKETSQFVGNKVKGRISKRVFKENKARKIFRKTKISYPLIQSVPTSQNGQTHSNNSSVKADQLFVWSWRLKSSEQLLFKKRCLWPNLTSRNCLEWCEKLWEILFLEYLCIFGTKEVVFSKINIKYVRNLLQISRLTLSEFKEVRSNKNLPMNFL